MPLSDDKITIAVFSLSASERDYLRNCVTDIPATVLCFENEANIFDNLKSILPKIVIVRTDTKAIVWRFIFAMHALEVDCALLIASDVLRARMFNLQGVSILLKCVPSKSNGVGLNEAIKGVILNSPPVKEMNNHPLLIGETEAIKRIRSMLPSLIKSSDPVLIRGEDGTGKELLSRLIVANRHASFVKLNCAELVPEMIARLRVGNGFLNRCQDNSDNAQPHSAFQLVFLLDKINMLHPKAQSEILLLLEGISKNDYCGPEGIDSGVRFIATSEENLRQLVQQGRFRKDLFYRLNVIPIDLPPLRERISDISLLMDYFIIDACVRTHRSFIIPAESIREDLCYYKWPGNLSELKKLMYRTVLAGDESYIVASYIIPNDKTKKQPDFWQTAANGVLPDAMELERYLPEIDKLSLKGICDNFVSRAEKELMKKALDATNWNRKQAAELLNISYKSMLNKIKAYNIV